MQETKSASERLEQVLKEKDKENKRLRDSFETLKHHNESLKSQVSCVSLVAYSVCMSEDCGVCETGVYTYVCILRHSCQIYKQRIAIWRINWDIFRADLTIFRCV